MVNRENTFILGGIIVFTGFFMLIGINMEFMTYVSVAVIMIGALILFYCLLNDKPLKDRPKGP